jgi:tetratricopeptide (TPR) repeat protein
MGLILFHGIDILGVEPAEDLRRGFHFLHQAADELPTAKAIFALESLNTKRCGEPDENTIEESIELLLQAADDESPDALYALAEFYDEGKYVQANNELATAYLEKAVALEFPNAQLRLGIKLAENKENEAAMALFDQAISQGFAEAAVAKGELKLHLGQYESAIDAFEAYIKAPWVDKPECKISIQLKVSECLIKIAGDDLDKLQDALYQIVRTMASEERSQYDYDFAKGIAKPALKKLRGKFRHNNPGQTTALVFGFRKDGSLRPISESMELMNNLAAQSDPSCLPKDIYPLIDKKQNTVKAKVKIGRNDPCHCESGKKYKLCCA